MEALSEQAILVTGAAGFVGRSLVQSLLGAGVSPHQLRCLVRRPDEAERRGLPAAALRTGDLTQPGSLAAAATGVDLVFHVAGALVASRRDGYDAVNRLGTQHLVDALRREAPDCRVVLVSSLAAAGPAVDGRGADAPPDRCRPVSRYGESKRGGELAVAGSGLPHAIVRPPVVYGPGDAATQLLFAQATAPICLVPARPRPLSIIHVRDLVDALLAAAAALVTRPGDVDGAALPVEGPDRTDTHALMRAIAAACGRRARLLPVPLPIAAVAALAADMLARLTGRASFFNGDKVRELRAPGWVADDRATRQRLGWRPATTLRAGLDEVARAAGSRPRATSATA